MWRKQAIKAESLKNEIETRKDNVPGSSAVTVKDPVSTSKNRARERWAMIFGKVAEENALSRARRENKYREELIEEIKRVKQRSRVKGSVLSVLKTQANLTEKVFERQKYSAKESLSRKRAASTKSVSGLPLGRKRGDFRVQYGAEFDAECQLRYKITPKIEEKLKKIQKRNEDTAEKRVSHSHDHEEGKGTGIGGFWRTFNATIIGQTLRANPRFYKMDPHAHLPDICRRCRRPLVDTLEARFTSIGILFCLFFPIIGILLLYANREFVCVICEESYVYGDLTASPDDEFDDDEEGSRKT